MGLLIIAPSSDLFARSRVTHTSLMGYASQLAEGDHGTVFFMIGNTMKDASDKMVQRLGIRESNHSTLRGGVNVVYVHKGTSINTGRQSNIVRHPQARHSGLATFPKIAARATRMRPTSRVSHRNSGRSFAQVARVHQTRKMPGQDRQMIAMHKHSGVKVASLIKGN